MLGIDIGLRRGSARAQPQSSDIALELDFRNGSFRQGQSVVAGHANLSQLQGYSFARSGSRIERSGDAFQSFGDNAPAIAPGSGFYARASVTNLVTHSQVFSQWTPFHAAVSTAAPTAPDGTPSANRLIETSSYGYQCRYRQTASPAAGVHTASLFAKKSERSVVWMQLENGSNYATIHFDLNTGTVQSAGGSLAVTPAIETVGDGWYRLTVTATLAAAPTYIYAGLSNSTSSQGAYQYAGDGSSGATFWQAQLVRGSDAGPVIPTGSATVATGADNLRLHHGFMQDEDFLLLVRAKLLNLSGRKNFLGFSGSGVAADSLTLHAESGSLGASVVNGGVSQDTGAFSLAAARGEEIALALRRRGGKFTVAGKAGGTFSTGTEGAPASLPPIDRFEVGLFLGSEHADSLISYVGYRKGSFSDSDVGAALAAS
jgi:hypothetical protein